MTVSNNEPVLSQDHQAVVLRFIYSLDDIGVKSALRSAVLERLPHGKVKAGMRNFNRALRDVLDCNPLTVQEAGVSLKIVVDAARPTNLFPEDVLPTPEIVSRCVDRFWSDLRQEADDSPSTGVDADVTP